MSPEAHGLVGLPAGSEASVVSGIGWFWWWCCCNDRLQCVTIQYGKITKFFFSSRT